MSSSCKHMIVISTLNLKINVNPVREWLMTDSGSPCLGHTNTLAAAVTSTQGAGCGCLSISGMKRELRVSLSQTRPDTVCS